MLAVCVGLTAAPGFAADESVSLNVQATVGDQFSFDYEVLMFVDDPYTDGVLYPSTDLDFGALVWEYGRWNGQYAFAIKMYCDSNQPYDVKVGSPTGIISGAKDIDRSVIISPDWIGPDKPEGGDKFTWAGFDPTPGIPCDDANSCKLQAPRAGDEFLVEAKPRLTVNDNAFSVAELRGPSRSDYEYVSSAGAGNAYQNPPVGNEAVIYASGATPVSRVIRSYISIYNIPEWATSAQVPTIPGTALRDVDAGTYSGTITFTMYTR